MLHHVKKGSRERTRCYDQDRTELLKLTLELERVLRHRSRKISESGRQSRATTSRRAR